MSEPTTEAGKRLLEELAEIREDYYPLADYPDKTNILAIEAEARAAVLRELREEVEEMPVAEIEVSRQPAWFGVDGLDRAAVLAAIDRRLEP